MAASGNPELVATLDLVLVDKSGKGYFAKDWQVFPLWQMGRGFLDYDIRMYLYTGVKEEGNFYAEDGSLIPSALAVKRGLKDIKLGLGCGCREIRASKNPIGQHCSYKQARHPGVEDIPMRLQAFVTMFNNGELCESKNRDIAPVIYATHRVACVEQKHEAWAPDYGWIKVSKTPIPVCISPYDKSIRSVGSNKLVNAFNATWADMIMDWALEHNVDSLFIGYDFTGTAPADKHTVDHLIDKAEWESDPQTRPFRVIPYNHRDPFGDLDAQKQTMIAMLRAGEIGGGFSSRSFLDL